MTQTPLLIKSEGQRFINSGHTWEQFKLIQRGFEGAAGVRLAYYEGTVEILMPGQDHEFFKTIIGMLIEAFLIELEVEFTPTGSMDQEREGIVATQAEESYCLGDSRSLPDLAIEVVFTSGGASKLARYQALDIPEVWFWQDGLFSLYHLRENGYEKITRSELPHLNRLDINVLTRCVLTAQTSKVEAVKAIRAAAH